MANRAAQIMARILQTPEAERTERQQASLNEYTARKSGEALHDEREAAARDADEN